MTDAKDEERGELDQDEVTATVPGLFKSRLRGKDVKIGETVFTMEGLPSLLSTMIAGDATDDKGELSDAKMLPEYLRYGIKKIKGLQDEVGNDVEIAYEVEEHYGKIYSCVPYAILDGITGGILARLYGEIVRLTHLTEKEAEKLDFITVSENEASTPGDGKETP